MNFGQRSLENLSTCHPDLVEIMEKVLSYEVMDFSIIEGHRTVARQQLLFKDGKSQLDGVNTHSRETCFLPGRAGFPTPRCGLGISRGADPRLPGVARFRARSRFCRLP